MGWIPALEIQTVQLLARWRQLYVKINFPPVNVIVPHWLHSIHTWWTAISHLYALHQMAGMPCFFLNGCCGCSFTALKDVRLWWLRKLNSKLIVPGARPKRKSKQSNNALSHSQSEEQRKLSTHALWLQGNRKQMVWLRQALLFCINVEKKRVYGRKREIRKKGCNLALLNTGHFLLQTLFTTLNPF